MERSRKERIMENITELVRRRRSVRTYDGREVNEDDLKKYTKFLIDREGKTVARFEPTEAIDHVKQKVEEIL